jgi:very-short-patch-repair endonuclease
LDPQIAAIALAQFGLVTRAQLLALGVSSNAIYHRLRTGLLRFVHRGVYALAGAPSTWDQHLMAALLAVENGAICDASAGVYWRLDGVSARIPDVMIPHHQRATINGVHVHRSRTIEQADFTRRPPLVLTTPTRTIVDLAGALTFAQLQNALDDALRRGLTTVGRLQARLDRLATNARGTGRLRRLLTDRSSGGVPGSALEASFARLLQRRGYVDVIRQHDVRDASGRLVARVDFAFPDAKLAIEIDGAHHADRGQWNADLARQNRLIVLGWRYLRFTGDQLRDQRTWEAIATALGNRTLT